MAPTTAELHPAIQRYLMALKERLRQTPGAQAEEGLADAHEYLQSEWEAVGHQQPAFTDDELYRHFIRQFGPPDDVAAAYAQLPSSDDSIAVAAMSAPQRQPAQQVMRLAFAAI